jgi:hypothetical protein
MFNRKKIIDFANAFPWISEMIFNFLKMDFQFLGIHFQEFCKCISKILETDFQFLKMDFQDFGNGFSIFGN